MSDDQVFFKVSGLEAKEKKIGMAPNVQFAWILQPFRARGQLRNIATGEFIDLLSTPARMGLKVGYSNRTKLQFVPSNDAQSGHSTPRSRGGAPVTPSGGGRAAGGAAATSSGSRALTPPPPRGTAGSSTAMSNSTQGTPSSYTNMRSLAPDADLGAAPPAGTPAAGGAAARAPAAEGAGSRRPTPTASTPTTRSGARTPLGGKPAAAAAGAGAAAAASSGGLRPSASAQYDANAPLPSIASASTLVQTTSQTFTVVDGVVTLGRSPRAGSERRSNVEVVEVPHDSCISQHSSTVNTPKALSPTRSAARPSPGATPNRATTPVSGGAAAASATSRGVLGAPAAGTTSQPRQQQPQHQAAVTAAAPVTSTAPPSETAAASPSPGSRVRVKVPMQAQLDGQTSSGAFGDESQSFSALDSTGARAGEENVSSLAGGSATAGGGSLTSVGGGGAARDFRAGKASPTTTSAAAAPEQTSAAATSSGSGRFAGGGAIAASAAQQTAMPPLHHQQQQQQIQQQQQQLSTPSRQASNNSSPAAAGAGSGNSAVLVAYLQWPDGKREPMYYTDGTPRPVFVVNQGDADAAAAVASGAAPANGATILVADPRTTNSRSQTPRRPDSPSTAAAAAAVPAADAQASGAAASPAASAAAATSRPPPDFGVTKVSPAAAGAGAAAGVNSTPASKRFSSPMPQLPAASFFDAEMGAAAETAMHSMAEPELVEQVNKLRLVLHTEQQRREELEGRLTHLFGVADSWATLRHSLTTGNAITSGASQGDAVGARPVGPPPAAASAALYVDAREAAVLMEHERQMEQLRKQRTLLTAGLRAGSQPTM